jgi:hypothetical protein
MNLGSAEYSYAEEVKITEVLEQQAAFFSKSKRRKF